jgi:beta-galactosidase
LEILRSFGCNAIRTSHNPPSQELLEVCDEKGFMVMDEIFDEWKVGKNPNGYALNFDEWFDRDITDFVRRDRNHPCVIFWSSGNEINEQIVEYGKEIVKNVVEVFHREDPSRAVTAACNRIHDANKTGFADYLDIVGYNYAGDIVQSMGGQGFTCFYDLDHERFPNRIIFGSENVSALMTRGIYHWPIIDTQDRREDFHCNAFDLKTDITLIILKTRPFVYGCFTWTGFDYLGEPTPYNWPTRSSQYGIVDTCGFPKDIYYLYKSQWTSDPMVHIVPSNWNWHAGMTIPVWVYTNCESAELFLNDRSLGEQIFDEDDIAKLMWEVPFEEGELKAVAKNQGEEVVTTMIMTARWPHHLEMAVDRPIIDIDRDLVYITISIHDENGILVPDAQNLITFTIDGPGEIVGTDNGNPISHEPFGDAQRHAFSGYTLAVVRSMRQDGIITVRASSVYLQGATAIIEVKKIK